MVTDVVSVYAPRREHPGFMDYRPLLELQRKSCERFGARQVVVTDEPGAAELGDFECFVVSGMPQALMPALVRGYWAYIAGTLPERDTILTGADCLLASDPASVFESGPGFDLALTTEDFADCILNTGGQFVSAGRGGYAEPFYWQAMQACGDAWGDDQRSLARAVGATLDHGDHVRTLPPGAAQARARIRFLPCRGFNQAPDRVDDAIRPVIAHFRGPRKAWAAEWAARHLGL